MKKMAEVLDYHMQHVLRRFIDRLPADEQAQLKSLRLCCQSVRKDMRGVYLLASNDGRARYFGHVSCKNPFACPVCASQMMEKYRARIATAIDLLYKDYFGFMFTLTIPHWRFMSCRETTDILNDSWKYFNNRVKKDKSWRVFQQFVEAVGLAHHVRVIEHTFGKQNGWHPHIHGLMWVPHDKADEVLKWELSLDEYWLKGAKRCMLKYWKKHKLHENILESGKLTYDQLADRVFSCSEGKLQGLFFSRAKGKLGQAHASSYICGWGADREATGNIRKEASNSGHYTPYQILLKAEHDKLFEDIYMEFCLAMRRKPAINRVKFSNTGISKMIDAYQREHGSESVSYQKKKLDGEPVEWRVVCYFSEEQWCELTYQNAFAPVLSNILYLASQRREILLEYILSVLPDFFIRDMPLAGDIERIFNAA